MKPEMVLKPEFVEFIPDTLEGGSLYIAAKYRTAVHLCCCGCGRKVVTPLAPTAWKLLFDGVSVTLYPSIGNWNFPCQSHYCIDRNHVRWAGRWTQGQIESGRAAEERARAAYYGEELPATTESRPSADIPKPAASPREGFWRWLWRQVFGS